MDRDKYFENYVTLLKAEVHCEDEEEKQKFKQKRLKLREEMITKGMVKREDCKTPEERQNLIRQETPEIRAERDARHAEQRKRDQANLRAAVEDFFGAYKRALEAKRKKSNPQQE